MAPKAAKGKAAPKGAAPKAGESKDAKWVRKQLSALAAQREAAIARGDAWVEEHHRWHEAQLEELLERLAGGQLESLPDEVREGVEFYASQLEGSDAVTEDAFYDDRELYSALLASKGAEDAPPPPYERPEEAADALEAIAWVGKWEATSPQVVDALERKLNQFASSAGVQEMGLKRVSWAILDGKEKGSVPTSLGAKRVVPLVRRALQRCPRDPAVQRQGCATLRALSMVDGGMTAMLDEGGAKIIVEALQACLYDGEAAESIARTLSDLTTRTEANSPERAAIKGTGVIEVLSKVSLLHQDNQMIEKAAKTTIPFLRE